MFNNLGNLVSTFKSWTKAFSPAPVLYQIGYENDEKWWSKFDNPIQHLGDELCKAMPDNGQSLGIIWVDFTLGHKKVKKQLFSPIWD